MKKVIVIALTLVMVFAISVPAFATTLDDGMAYYNGTALPVYPSAIDSTTYCYSVVLQDNSTGTYYLHMAKKELSVTSDGLVTSGGYYKYYNNASSWVNVGSGGTVTSKTWSLTSYTLVWTSVTLYDESGAVYMVGTSPATEESSGVEPPDWDVDTYPFGFIMAFPQSMEIYFYAYDVRGQATAVDGYFGVQGPANGIKYKYDLDNGTWSLISTLEVEDEWIQWDKDLTALYWTNYNVYTKDGEPFFMVTSVMTDILMTISLGDVLKVVLMMIPLCLVFLAGFVGLRKALALLRKTLEQS